ncbi:MAG: NAD-dependent epimerase/dehydratase family protein [Muribaculaceae bacterium]|nr:NAD-dependent epimerase/dehydratase family protein [Muribaculaceae bacterium]
MITTILQQDFDYSLLKLSEVEKNKLKDATILVTGCAGFLGYYLLNFLNNKSDVFGFRKIIALDNYILERPKWIDELSENNKFDIRKFDIVNDSLDVLCDIESVDYVVHMASIASPTYYRSHPIETIEANVLGLKKLLDYYKNKNLRGFLFFSSSEIYGDPTPEAIPTDEEYRGSVSCTGPRACYDESKRIGETLCRVYADKFDMPIGVVRPFNNYGPGMRLDDKRVVADFSHAAINNSDIVVLSDGMATRTFCYISDAIVGYLKILLHGDYGYYNIGIDSDEISVVQLAELYKKIAEELLNYKGEIVFRQSDDKDYLTDNPSRRRPNIDKARKILGYDPEISVQDGVRRLLLHLKEIEKVSQIW